MNPARTLADRFRTQRTDRVRVDGVEVLSLTELTITEGDAVEIVIEQFRDDIEQSLHIRSVSADLQVIAHQAEFAEDYVFNDLTISESITLVADQARRIEFILVTDDDLEDENEEMGPVTLQLWNSWLIGRAEHAWTGNSGLVVEHLDAPAGAHGRFRLWCSDGLGDPQFDNLVVVVTVGPKM